MTSSPWDALDAALLAVLEQPRTLAELIEASGYPRDMVAGLVDGYLAAGYVTQPLPGCGQYQITLTGRTYLVRITAATAADIRKAA